MKSTRNLRLRLRLIEGALILLLGALTLGAVATHQLLLDATNRPVDDVNFSGPHWVGTLDPARLPASVPLLDDAGNLTVPGELSAANGITGADAGGRIGTNDDGGNIDTSNGGGYVVTNGNGAPTDGGAPLGSLYLDQDPDGSSGHVLWVMGPTGWVGK